VRLSWVRALAELGYEVYFLEQLSTAAATTSAGVPCAPADSHQRRYFDEVVTAFDLIARSALVNDAGVTISGLATDLVQQLATQAVCLVNISGHLACESLCGRFRRKAYIDIDPGFTQFWHAQGNAGARLAGHDLFFTIGENIGTPQCCIPTGDVRWRPIRQPVTLADWPVTPASRPNRFTTVANWRNPFGTIEFGGRTYGLKVHEFRKFWDLPTSATQQQWEIALNIYPGDERDRQSLWERGWQLSEPATVGSPAQFREFIQESGAEFSVAQGVYVDTQSGWLSDRTIRYLASGRPALVQDTGFAANVPAGLGLLTFRTFAEAVAGAAEIANHYVAHSVAARQLAEQYFAPSVALAPLLAEIDPA